MSNPEANPAETVCEPGLARLEILQPREVPLGGLRAMNVRRTLPQRGRSLIGAWCFLDHYGPDDVSLSGGMNVPAHPHIGLQTVSWLFSGEIEHRDSAGYHAIVRPGELNLMTAGRGISHSERSTSETSVLHGTQLWIALPSHARDTPKTFEHYVPPLATGPGWSAQVFLGSLLGMTSPVSTHTTLVGAEIVLDPSQELLLEVLPSSEHGILIDSGSATVCSGRTVGLPRKALGGARPESTSGDSVSAHELAYLPAGESEIRITAGEGGVRLLLIGGEPFGEELVMWWNFVGRDHAEIIAARADWQAELSAAGVKDVAAETRARAHSDADADADASVGAQECRNTSESLGGNPRRWTGASATEAPLGRFGLPADEPEPPLSAPAAPIATLLPRRQ